MIDKMIMQILHMGVLVSLSGCSWLNIGENDYGCPGYDGKVSCISVEDAYNQSFGESSSFLNNKNISSPAPKVVKETDIDNKVESKEHSLSSREFLYETVPVIQPRELPAPIRTNSKVMRILISSWEDEEGSLHLPGYIYTEIEPRRWISGEKVYEDEALFTPLR